MSEDAEELKELADEIDEELQFVRAYIEGKLGPEIVKAIEEAQARGEAKTVGGAFDVAKKAGWKLVGGNEREGL